MNLTLALAQLQVASGDFSGNTSRALKYIEQAAAAKTDIVLFPEMWTAGFDYTDLSAYSRANSLFLENLQVVVDRQNLAVGGSYMLEDGGKYFNEFVLLRPGAPSLIYRKIHLFRLMEEDRHFSPGTRLTFHNTGWGPISLAVCYDLRFPEMFLRIREKGVALVLLSAAWPEKRIDHWKALLRARAIENQCYFAAVNCAGGVTSAPFGGASAVIGPWGETVAEAVTAGEELVFASVDLEQVNIVREKFPFFKDRLSRYFF